ncbi:MAG TPA: hypothetical protein VGW38_13250, partial [Chloroflexota bacterium]|nr:hypothetical protein [Chloroflexota bacterium]
LRQRSTRELPVTATGSLAWVALANEKVLVEVEAEGDRLQLLIDGVPDDLLELEVEGDGDQFLSTDGLLSDCCHEILESWKQRVQWALDDGWGEVVAVARDAGLEWSVTERDTQGEPVALWLFGRGRDIHWSKAWGWEVGDLRLPGGLSGAALQAAIAVARV